MTEHLMVRCKVCGQGFPVVNQMSRSAFQDPANLVSTKGHRCTKCGQTRVYERGDHYFG